MRRDINKHFPVYVSVSKIIACDYILYIVIFNTFAYRKQSTYVTRLLGYKSAIINYVRLFYYCVHPLSYTSPVEILTFSMTAGSCIVCPIELVQFNGLSLHGLDNAFNIDLRHAFFYHTDI